MNRIAVLATIEAINKMPGKDWIDISLALGGPALGAIMSFFAYLLVDNIRKKKALDYINLKERSDKHNGYQGARRDLAVYNNVLSASNFNNVLFNFENIVINKMFQYIDYYDRDTKDLYDKLIIMRDFFKNNPDKKSMDSLRIEFEAEFKKIMIEIDQHLQYKAEKVYPKINQLGIEKAEIEAKR
ncbi:MAG: hypothetical protein M0Q51_16155 [Bacteroidales bacterium]|nr:hypothetical protein [Bacteroidales bacterium]